MGKIFKYNKLKLTKSMKNIVFFLLGIIVLFVPIRKNFYLNLTESSPMGIYKIINSKEYKVGDFICIDIKNNDKIITKDKSIPFIKKIVAKQGDIINIKDYQVYINENYLCSIVKKDFSGKDLAYQEFNNYELKEDEFYVLGENPYSYDSRYYGIILKKNIICAVKLVF